MLNDVTDQLAIFMKEVGMERKLGVQTVVGSVEGIKQQIMYVHS